MRFIVRSTPRVESLAKGDMGLLPPNGGEFKVGSRTWRFVNFGRFSTITTRDAGAIPFTVICIPAMQARMRAVQVGRELDRGLTPSSGTYRKPGQLPTEGGGVELVEQAA